MVSNICPTLVGNDQAGAGIANERTSFPLGIGQWRKILLPPDDRADPTNVTYLPIMLAIDGNAVGGRGL